MKRKITELIIILFFYIMQVSAARVISIANISPNWLIIMPVFFGFFCGKNDGMFAGFFAGIMYDLFYSGLFGFTALIFIYIGYFSGFFYQKYEVRDRLNVGFFMSRFILPEVVYTALVSLLIYHPIHYFCVITEQGKERKKKGKIDEGSI